MEAASDDSQPEIEPEVDLSPEEFDALVTAAKQVKADQSHPIVNEPEEEPAKEKEEEQGEENKERLQPLIEVEETLDSRTTPESLTEPEVIVKIKPEEAAKLEPEEAAKVVPEEAAKQISEETAKLVPEEATKLEPETNDREEIDEQKIESQVNERIHQERAIDVAEIAETKPDQDENNKTDKVPNSPEVEEKETSEENTTPKSAKHKKKGFFSFFKRKPKHKDEDKSPSASVENQTTPLSLATTPSSDQSKPPTVESSPVVERRTSDTEKTTPPVDPVVIADEKVDLGPEKSPPVPIEQVTPPIKNSPLERSSRTTEERPLYQNTPIAEESEEDTVTELPSPDSKPHQGPDSISIADSEVECAMTPPPTLTAAQPTPFTRAGLLQQQHEQQAVEPLIAEVVDSQATPPRHVDNHFVVVAIDFGTTFRL